MTDREIVICLLIMLLFCIAPNIGCAGSTALCIYLYFKGEMANEWLLIAAGVFAIAGAINNLKDLELKLNEEDTRE